MSFHDEVPAPGLAPAFTLVLGAPEITRVGQLATGGVREHRAFAAGSFAGERIRGELVAEHSGETWLRRLDAVAVVEAIYFVRTEDGQTLRIVGTGYATEGGDFTGLRMTLVIEADEVGPHAWVTRTAFVAERLSGSDQMQIAVVT